MISAIWRPKANNEYKKNNVHEKNVVNCIIYYNILQVKYISELISLSWSVWSISSIRVTSTLTSRIPLFVVTDQGS